MIETLDEKKEFYTRQCLILFLKNGIKNLTIGDITKELNISSKTLYKIYGDKIGLVKECLLLYQENTKKKYQEIFNEGQKIDVDVYMSTYFLIFYSMGKMNPHFLTDLTRYFTTDEQLDNILGRPMFVDLLTRVRRDGFIKRDLDIDVIVESLLVLLKHFLIKGSEEVTMEEKKSFFVNVLWSYTEGLAEPDTAKLLREKRSSFVELFEL